MILDKSNIEKELRAGEEISIIKLVDSLIEYAYNSRASDIHLNPTEGKLSARLRIDGVMHDVFMFPKEIQEEIISRIKVLSGLRTDEHKTAQDGRFKFFTKDETKFDVRISIVPTYVASMVVDPNGGASADTKYQIFQNATTGRITVGASQANAETSDSQTISVTR